MRSKRIMIFVVPYGKIVEVTGYPIVLKGYEQYDFYLHYASKKKQEQIRLKTNVILNQKGWNITEGSTGFAITLDSPTRETAIKTALSKLQLHVPSGNLSQHLERARNTIEAKQIPFPLNPPKQAKLSRNNSEKDTNVTIK